MKKYSWIVVLLVALSFTIFFNSCGADFDPSKLPAPTWEVDLDADDCEFIVIGQTTGQSVDGNKYTLVNSDATSAGFALVPPATEPTGVFKWTDYQKVRVTIKIVEITTSSNPPLAKYGAKASRQMNSDVLVYGSSKEYDNEIPVDGEKGEEAYADYPVNKFDGEIAFQYNVYDANGKNSALANANQTVEVTFTFFTGDAP